MKEITKIEILSMGKVHALILAFLGLIIGLLVGLIGAVVGSFAAAYGGIPAFLGAGFGILAIIVFPIMYGILGFLGGIIVAVLYNLVARWVGGIEIELKDKESTGQKA